MQEKKARQVRKQKDAALRAFKFTPFAWDGIDPERKKLYLLHAYEIDRRWRHAREQWLSKALLENRQIPQCVVERIAFIVAHPEWES